MEFQFATAAAADAFLKGLELRLGRLQSRERQAGKVTLRFERQSFRPGDTVYRDPQSTDWYAGQLSLGTPYTVTADLGDGYYELEGFVCPVHYSGLEVR